MWTSLAGCASAAAVTQVVLYFAHAENGVIGRDGDLPWRLPADLRRFKRLTQGKPMVMGRRTFESLPGLLPGRRHIVLTRDPAWTAAGAEVAHDVAGALDLAGDVPEVAVIGGAEVFRLFLDRAVRAEVTAIRRAYPGDTVFRLDPGQWDEVAREDHPVEGEAPAFTFFTLEKRR